MSEAEVTRAGLRGQRPGREALVGSTGGHEPRRRPARREDEMVPPASFDSYYGRPILNQPTWKAPDIAGYFFLGGLAGASSVLGAGAELTGRERLARACKVGALGAVGGSLFGLIHDLGRPERFINMLRIVRPTSPMSMGSWLLAAYGPAAGVAAVTSATGLFPRIGRLASLAAAALGPAVASYTAVLVSNTAVPAWHEGYREMPFVFVGSAAASAGGLGLVAAPLAEADAARRAAVLGTALELGAEKLMELRMGFVGEPYRKGTGGRLLRAAQALSLTGAIGAATVGRRSRVAAVASGVALLAGSAMTRFGIFHAGMESARDPAYTVRPQRERLAARQG